MIATTVKACLKMSSVAALGIFISLFGAASKVGAEADMSAFEAASTSVAMDPSVLLSPGERLSDGSSDAGYASTYLLSDMRSATQKQSVLTSQAIPTAQEPSFQPELAQAVDGTFSPLSDDDIREQLLIDPSLDPADIRSGGGGRPRAVPSPTFLTPTAYGADWGDAYIGAAGSTVNDSRFGDGSIGFGVGFGDAVENIGVELNAGIYSIEGFADDGAVGFKLHKVFPRLNNLAVAAGWTNPIAWGAAQDLDENIYGVVTQQYNIRPGKDNPVPLTASLGVGTSSFTSTEDNDNDGTNIFGSVGVRVIPQVSLNTSWTGNALGLAASAAPFRAPLVFTAGVSDITDNTDVGTQFVGSFGYSFSF